MQNEIAMALLLKGIEQVAMVIGGGGLLWVFVAALKKAQPFLQGNAAALRTIAVVLSTVGTLAAKASAGTLEPKDLQDVASTVLDVAAVWLTAHAIHKATKPKAEGSGQ